MGTSRSKVYSRSRNWQFAKIEKSCPPKYKTRKILEIFHKNRVYQFVTLNFSTFRHIFKRVVRKCKHISMAPICTLQHIRIKNIYLFEDWRFAKIQKTCSLKYETRKFYKIFLKNRVYRFAILNFSTFLVIF